MASVAFIILIPFDILLYIIEFILRKKQCGQIFMNKAFTVVLFSIHKTGNVEYITVLYLKKEIVVHLSDITKNKVEEYLLIWENVYHVLLNKNWQKSALTVRHQLLERILT